jgi:hypothetical protein
VVRRPVAWIVALVLFVEALGVGAVNWFLGVVVDRQHMSLAGLDPHLMSVSSKAGGIVLGLHFALCGLVALLVALRDRAPAGPGRALLISAAVVHALLGALGWGLVGPHAFLYMVVVLGLVVLLLMTHDHPDTPVAPVSAAPVPADPAPRGAEGAPVTPPAAPTAP